METSTMARARAVVSGRVQGVGFRAFAYREARRRGLAGWVRNLPDGTVEAVVQGRKHEVEGFLSWCGRGPPLARVDKVLTAWEHPQNDVEGFELREYVTGVVHAVKSRLNKIAP